MSVATVTVSHNEQRAMEKFQASLNWATGNAESAAASARKYKTVKRWNRHLRRRIGEAAFSTSLIPGLHGAGIALEMPYLLRLMGRGAIGTGELMGAKVEAESDLPAIFAHWSGAINKNAFAAAAGGVVLVDSIPYPAFGTKVLALGFKLGVKVAASEVGGPAAGTAAGAMAGPASHLLQPILRKIMVKVSAKISAAIGAKAMVGLAPLAGAAISVGISRHILGDFLASARLYYTHKLTDA